MELVSGHVGGLDMFVAKDVITVIDDTHILLKHQVPGLSRFLTEHQGRVRLTLGRTEDFTILGLYGPDNFGYAINLDDPELSEWGYGGRGEEHQCERPNREAKP